MNARFSPFLSAIALSALAFLLTPTFSQASVTTLSGGDPADASDGIGYAPTGTLIEAYRMTTSANDESAYTYKGITFQPFVLNGNGANPTANFTTQGTPPLTANLTNGFFYQLGAGQNVGVGGGALSSDDLALYNVAQYMAYATNGNRADTSGTMTLVLSGLAAGSTYQIDLLVGDAYNGNTLNYVYTMTGAGASTTDTVAAPRAYDPLSFRSDVYDVNQNIVADISGNITVVATAPGTGDNAAIYAFSVEFVPEPASMSLLAAGSLLLLRRRPA